MVEELRMYCNSMPNQLGHTEKVWVPCVFHKLRSFSDTRKWQRTKNSKKPEVWVKVPSKKDLRKKGKPKLETNEPKRPKRVRSEAEPLPRSQP